MLGCGLVAAYRRWDQPGPQAAGPARVGGGVRASRRAGGHFGHPGAWLHGWRLLAIDGFDVDLPDTPGDAEEFGYAGSGTNRSALPKARLVALAECGTHAFLAAEVDAYAVGEKTRLTGSTPGCGPRSC
jgi:hypothetical protein